MWCDKKNKKQWQHFKNPTGGNKVLNGNLELKQSNNQTPYLYKITARRRLKK